MFKGLFLSTLLLGTLSFNVTAATKDEMVAFVKKAQGFIKEKGFDTACAEFNKSKEEGGTYQEGELYMFAYDFEGKVLCHGAKKAIIGKNLITFKGPDGKLTIQELLNAAKAGTGFVEYKWENPTTKTVDDKIGYAVKIDDKVWIGSGVYVKK